MYHKQGYDTQNKICAHIDQHSGYIIFYNLVNYLSSYYFLNWICRLVLITNMTEGDDQ